MINLAENNKLVADNRVVIGGLEYMLTDDETIRLNDVIKGLISARNGGQQKTVASVAKQKKAFSGKAKDVELNMKANGKTVKIDGYVGKDVWEVLKRRFELLGGKYEKDSKSIVFGAAKDAKTFVGTPIVTAEERESIWKEWRA